MPMPKPVRATSSNKLTVTLHGHDYIVACDPAEEPRLKDIVRLVESRLNEIARRGSHVTETRLLMLACLQLADELIEARRAAAEMAEADEDLMVAAVEHLRGRVMAIAQQIGNA